MAVRLISISLFLCLKNPYIDIMGVRVVFDDLISKLRSVKDDSGKSVFGTVKINRGDMAAIKGFENTNSFLTFPCILLKPEEIKNVPRPNNVYVTEMRIRVHVVTNDLVHEDELDIFDLPELVDRTMLDGKWDTVNLVSIVKGFDVFPEQYDNNEVYELNYWIKYWNTNAFTYRDWVDANDTDVNPEAPIELDLGGHIGDEFPYP